MTIAQALAYAVYDFPLDVAEGGRVLDFQAGYIHVARFFNQADGTEYQSGLIECALSLAANDWLPLGFNSEISLAVPRDRVRVRWAAQPGATVRLVLARDPNQFRLSNPLSTLRISTAAGTVLATGSVNIGTGATLIRAASASRQSLMLQNAGSFDVFIGDAAVATATGFPLAPGATLAVDKTTAAVYGISGTTGQPVRYLEEA